MYQHRLRRLAWISSVCCLGLVGCNSDGETPSDGGLPPDQGPLSDSDQRPGLYLRGATVITATGQPPLSGMAVVVRGDTIEAIEPERTDPPPALEKIDLDGMTLLPGLIDSHVHIGCSGGSMKVPTDLCLDFGVTTIKDLTGPLDDLLLHRQEIEDGKIVGPRLAIVGPGFTPPGGHPVDTLYKGDEYLINNAIRAVTDPAEARAEVKKLAQVGVDLIKVFVTACEGWGTCQRIDLKVLAAIVSEAHAQGLRVVAHTDANQDVRDAIDAGVDGVEHGVTVKQLDADLPQVIAKAKVYYVPTLGAAAIYGPCSDKELVERLSLMRQAGVRVVVGTDADAVIATWGASVHKELVYMVMAGYTPMEAIIAATRTAAEHLQWQDRLGTIEPGKLADLIAVNGDPIKEISIVHDVRLVVKDGKVVRSEL